MISLRLIFSEKKGQEEKRNGKERKGWRRGWGKRTGERGGLWEM
jgi:hypothetical protein